MALTVVELQALGFFEAGTCMLDQGLMSGVRFHVAVSKDARVIYAFAVDDQVKYIGVCDNSGTCLGHRMSRYQGMMGRARTRGLLSKSTTPYPRERRFESSHGAPSSN